TDERVHAIGAVDELNSFIGLLAVELATGNIETDGSTGAETSEDADFTAVLKQLQQELFDLGAHLATLGAAPVPDMAWLDDAVSDLNAQLPPLTEFVIPGGSRAAALTHVCRTVCRRAERHCWGVAAVEPVGRYLNRLSDLLFVMARLLTTGDEPQWRGPRKR
ncbi:MAG: cob(I)yrinic acid a,c-diamide adenosyltransferase, partial [Pseudomonadales bacterium]